MKDLLRKSILTGIGLISLSRDRCEDLVRQWVEKGKLSEKEGRDLVDNLLKEASEQKGELKETLESVIEEASDRFHLARHSDLEKLREQVVALTEEVASLKGELASLKKGKDDS